MATKIRSDGSNLSSSEKQVLEEVVKGEVIFKGEAPQEKLDDLLKRWNEVFTKPANIVVLVEDEEDVVASVNFATRHGLDVAVAGGRHSYHGASSTTGLVIDLRKLNNVVVDKAAKTVTSGGGCLARDLEKPAEAEGLGVVFGVVNETGIGGLTLGGGIGWLSGQYGLALDTLISARVVLANGDIVTASETENEDLFWGIRGAGYNFGICTEFTFRAHEQGLCFFQIVVFPMEKLDDCLSILENLRIEAIEPANAFIIFYDGPEEEARKLAAPIYDLGPLTTLGGITPYSEVTNLYEKFRMDGFDRWGSSSAYLDYPVNTEIVATAINELLATVKRHAPDFDNAVFIMDLRDYRKVASIPNSATAYANRYHVPMLTADFRWDKPELDKTARDEAKNITNNIKAKVKEFRNTATLRTEGQRDISTFYGNIASGDERSESLYGENLPRLKELKKKYDPNCLWDKWWPIFPE